MVIDLELLKTNTFQNEDVFQAFCIKLISQEFPIFRDKVFHAMNEQYIPRQPKESDDDYKLRCLKYGNANKAKGKLAGVMDILIIHNGILYKIELKQPNGILGKEQERLIPIWNIDCCQIPVIVCHTAYHVWKYCKWIQRCDLKINFSDNFKMFEL